MRTLINLGSVAAVLGLAFLYSTWTKSQVPLPSPSIRPLPVQTHNMSLSIASTVKLSSGYSMPRLGFGVWQNRGDSCTNAVAAALASGYRHIDSAVAYANEAEVGKAVKENPLGLKREDIFVTTKIMSHDGGYEATKKMVTKSLQKFGFDYIDLYLIHDPVAGKDRRLATYRALLEEQEAGKIRSVGVSNYGIKHLEEIAQAGFPAPAVNQLEVHPFCQQRPIGEYCKKHGIVVEAYTPLARDKINHPVIEEVADKYNVSKAQILIRWSLQRGFVPLPKSATPSRVAENANVYDFDIEAEDVAKIDALDLPYRLDGTSQGALIWNPVAAP